MKLHHAMDNKKWDVYVYGDVNIDLVIPGITKFPEPGQEDETKVMETMVGGGAALFTLGLGKLGLHPVFQGSVGDDLYGRFILEEFAARHVDTQLLEVSKTLRTGISLSFTNEKDRSFLTILDFHNVLQRHADLQNLVLHPSVFHAFLDIGLDLVFIP